jgi:hypothetical protein
MASVCFEQKRNSFPSAPLSDYEDNDLLSFTEILARTGRVQPPTRPPFIDLTCNSADHDIGIS